MTIFSSHTQIETFWFNESDAEVEDVGVALETKVYVWKSTLNGDQIGYIGSVK